MCELINLEPTRWASAGVLEIASWHGLRWRLRLGFVPLRAGGFG
jgi:hypothetical protein